MTLYLCIPCESKARTLRVALPSLASRLGQSLASLNHICRFYLLFPSRRCFLFTNCKLGCLEAWSEDVLPLNWSACQASPWSYLFQPKPSLLAPISWSSFFSLEWTISISFCSTCSFSSWTFTRLFTNDWVSASILSGISSTKEIRLLLFTLVPRQVHRTWAESSHSLYHKVPTKVSSPAANIAPFWSSWARPP